MYPREVRLGIVMYGGVSLAIYENGVAQELYRTVRGEGVYALLKDLIQSDIVVDIISGTSAGGVNAILLGYALANNRDFTSVAKLWREHGDIASLLREAGDPRTESWLDSENYYQPRLAEALAEMKVAPAEAGSVPSEITELDLFVTGTNLDGHVQTVYDDLGHPIDVKDHRSVFKLAYRKGRKNDFRKGVEQELAQLARLTSCFPVAFAPVVVNVEAANLRSWGKLQRDAVFLDGGILDNKPFSCTTDAIYRRTADREVDRLLLYVEPDPERFEQSRTVDAPSIATSAIEALIGIPGYQSISEDLRAIGRNNTQIARFNDLLKCLPAYSAGEESGCENSPEWCVYLTSRWMQLRDRAVAGVLNKGPGREYFASENERRSGRILVKGFSLWHSIAHETLEAFDVHYRLRRLIHLTYCIRGELNISNGRAIHEANRQHYVRLWRVINHHVKVMEILQSAMENLIDGSEIDWRSLEGRFRDRDGNFREPGIEELGELSKEVWAEVAMLFSRLLDENAIELPTHDSQAARTAFCKTLMARVATLVGKLPVEEPQGNLLTALDDELSRLMRGFAGSVPGSSVVSEFRRFLDIDRMIFPLQFSSGIQSRDLLRVVRVSPADAQRGHSGRPVEKKVCGKALGAFSPFFKRSWRSNDMLWGRLDAVCQILECTFVRDRIRRVTVAEKTQLQATLARLFPKSDPVTHAAIVQSLITLQSLDDDGFDNLLNLIVQAAQDEIICSGGWESVVKDAFEEENVWPHSKPLKSIPAGSVITSPAAQAIARGTLADFESTDIVSKRFVDKISNPVVLEIGSLIAMRLERSLVASMPEAVRNRLRKSYVYRFLIQWVIPTVHWFAVFHRTAPEWRVAAIVFLLAASSIGLVGGLLLLVMHLLHLSSTPQIYGPMILVSMIVIHGWMSFFRRQ